MQTNRFFKEILDDVNQQIDVNQHVVIFSKLK